MSDWVQLVPLLALAFLFWFLIIRTSRKRQREFARLQDSLNAGQRVMTTSGLFGDIVALDDEMVQLAIADGVVVTVARPAIARVESVRERPADSDSDSDSGSGSDD